MALEEREQTVDDLLASGRSILRASDLDISSREAAMLLAAVLDVDEMRVRTRGETRVGPSDAARFLDLARRRAAGTPSAYLLGRREFYGREFLVDPRVLVPRPETEHLVEAVLALDLPADARLLDVGTGSGCIAVTLALELPEAQVVATDLSTDALDVARHNACRLNAAVRFLCADLTAPLRLDAFDVVASNPPYVAHEAAAGMSREVTEHEPHLALFAPTRGTSVLERLLDAATELRPGATLLLELGSDQGDWLRDAVAARPGLELQKLIHDLAGLARTGVVRRSVPRR